MIFLLGAFMNCRSWPAADVQRPVQLPSNAAQVGRVAQRNPALHDRPHPCPMPSN